MGGESVTQLLTTLLIIASIVLFILITIFIFLTLKSKKEEKNIRQDGKLRNVASNKPKTSPEKIPSNVVQTKSYTTENVKKFMDFTEIKDNMIVQKEGKRFVLVIQCKGVNYDLMSAIEKSGVEQGFSQFLNTLTKPIQIHIQARKVNLEESIARYKKRLKIIENNFYKAQLQYDQEQKKPNTTAQRIKDARLEYVRQKNLYEYTRDIIANTERLSLNQNILTKNYYIAITYTPEDSGFLLNKDEVMEMAFSELYTNAQAILRTLSVCGITGKVLDSVELAELLYVAYNRDASELYDVDLAIKSGYDALYTTAPDVINKKIEQLDKVIEERAFSLANEVINKVELKSQREKELKQKEKNMEQLVKEMAKSMILESESYIQKEIIEKSIQEIEKTEQETKNKNVKKGA